MKGCEIMNYPNWIEEAIIMYKKEKNYTKIANKLNVNRKTISYYLKKKGFTSNKKYVRKIDPDKLRKYDYSYCEKIFEKINTEEKAYWLGFLYADGYVSNKRNTISLSLKKEDLKHLKEFRSFLKLENKKIQKKEKIIDNKKYISYSFSFDSEKVKKDLEKLGCINNKTFVLKFPNKKQVPNKMIRHFIRGYIDGDGCITNSSTSKIRLEVLGTKEFLTEYQYWTKNDFNKLCQFSKSDIYRSIYSGKNAIKILKIIYNNASIYLERKYNKFLQLAHI